MVLVILGEGVDHGEAIGTESAMTGWWVGVGARLRTVEWGVVPSSRLPAPGVGIGDEVAQQLGLGEGAKVGSADSVTRLRWVNYPA